MLIGMKKVELNIKKGGDRKKTIISRRLVYYLILTPGSCPVVSSADN